MTTCENGEGGESVSSVPLFEMTRKNPGDSGSDFYGITRKEHFFEKG